MSSPALAFPNVLTRTKAADAVSAHKPLVEYLVTLVPGETRPPEDLMPLMMERHEADLPVTREWRGMGVFESRGAAEAAIDWAKKQKDAHARDRWEIHAVTRNTILPRGRTHLKDSNDEPHASEYQVVKVSDLERIRDELRG